MNSTVRQVIAGVGVEETAQIIGPYLEDLYELGVYQMLDSMTVLRMVTLIAGSSNIELTKEQLMELNEKLNKVATS